MKAKNQNRTCPDVLSNECIVWQGGDVPGLGIYNGDELSAAEFIIATKILKLFDDIDMSDIDLNCIQDKCSQKCEDKSLKSIVQVLFDNQCCLNDLIKSITGGDVTVAINLNLRCLKVFDDFGNEIPQDLNQSLQSIVNQVCQNVTDITSVKASIVSLQNQIDNINTTPPVITEPSVTTCLTPGLRTVSQTIPLVAQAVCDLQTIIGNNVDISQAISQQCANLNSTFAGTQGWLSAVANFAQSVNNLWVLSCNLNSRITLIENNCCKVTCDDIELGFDVQLDSTGTGVFLKFTAKAGTSIPASFTDAGSSVIFTDKNNNYITYPLVISNNATQGDFDLSGLDVSEPITISVTAILATDGLTCEKCISRVYSLTNTACPVCQVTASGTSGSVTISYTLPGNTNVQTLVLQNSQSGYIQKNAVIIAVNSTGDVSADSTCIDLTPPPSTCYVYAWEHADSGPIRDAYFDKVTIGNLSYNINSPYFTPYPLGSPPRAGQQLLSAVGGAVPVGIMTPQCVVQDDTTAIISFTVPNTLGIPEFRIHVPGNVSTEDRFLYLKGIASTNGTDCSCGGSDF